MTSTTERDINGLAVRKLRAESGLSQAKFWGAIGISLARGNRYETGKAAVIPADVQRLVFLHYVIGIPTNAPPAELHELMKSAGPARQQRKNAELAIAHINHAEKALQDAKGKLS
ncbi:putative transcriptional regulator [Pseudomonas phage Skulduggery]|uniref:Putative transcriptional regulator n=1 Tax=Pseudomonas phage Skulduggery TaxID=2006671 RepID=A0A1Y0SUT1_9CAUD|nr:transcriptional regulator [Pseudomonas phage Skulduggery]ARV77140.1 putative transcriptional regulator [Pseudomonas phage Skulduggery]